MRVEQQNLSESAQVDQQSIQPFPRSQKIYVQGSRPDIRVPMREIFFEPSDHFAFDLYDHEGALHSIPLHRVKQVFRNGELIWHREH